MSGKHKNNNLEQAIVFNRGPHGAFIGMSIAGKIKVKRTKSKLKIDLRGPDVAHLPI